MSNLYYSCLLYLKWELDSFIVTESKEINMERGGAACRLEVEKNSLVPVKGKLLILPWLFHLQVAPPVPPPTDTPDTTADTGEGLPTTMGGPLPPHLALLAGRELECVCMTESKLYTILLGHHLCFSLG